jgi:hypothetical protein
MKGKKRLSEELVDGIEALVLDDGKPANSSQTPRNRRRSPERAAN